jgi:hypothetical protein
MTTAVEPTNVFGSLPPLYRATDRVEAGEPVNSRTAQYKATQVIHSPVWLTRYPTAEIPKYRERRAKRAGEERTPARALVSSLIQRI